MSWLAKQQAKDTAVLATRSQRCTSSALHKDRSASYLRRDFIDCWSLEKKGVTVAGKAADIADALDNTQEQMLWHWELRLLQSLPKQLQPAGKHLKKTLNEVGFAASGDMS